MGVTLVLFILSIRDVRNNKITLIPGCYLLALPSRSTPVNMIDGQGSVSGLGENTGLKYLTRAAEGDGWYHVQSRSPPTPPTYGLQNSL